MKLTLQLYQSIFISNISLFFYRSVSLTQPILSTLNASPYLLFPLKAYLSFIAQVKTLLPQSLSLTFSARVLFSSRTLCHPSHGLYFWLLHKQLPSKIICKLEGEKNSYLFICVSHYCLMHCCAYRKHLTTS